MVCITLIFEELEHVVLNPSSFHDVFLEIMLFASFILTTFHLYSFHLPYPCLGIGIGYTRKGCTLPCGKKGLKAQRVKVAGKS
jgi:hypothetical protein